MPRGRCDAGSHRNRYHPRCQGPQPDLDGDIRRALPTAAARDPRQRIGARDSEARGVVLKRHCQLMPQLVPDEHMTDETVKTTPAGRLAKWAQRTATKTDMQLVSCAVTLLALKP